MTAIHEMRLPRANDRCAPDEWDGTPNRPPADFVVSRDSSGKTLSTYADITWSLAPYTSDAIKNVLNFAFWPAEHDPIASQEKLVADIRWVMFLLLWRHPKMLSVATARMYLFMLKALAVAAHEQAKTLPQALGDGAFLDGLTRDWAKSMLTSLRAMLGLLYWLGADQVGFDVAADDVLQQIKERALKRRAAEKQHPVIPTRIYSHIISALTRELAEFERISPQLLEQARRGLNVQLPIDGPPVVGNELVEYFEKRRIEQSTRGIATVLMHAQAVAKHQIQLYSGMRTKEVENLPYSCLREVLHGGRVHYILKGATTKLNHGRRKAAQWVTSRDSLVGLRIARLVADLVYVHLGVVQKDAFPLFPAVGYLPISTSKLLPPNANSDYRTSNLELSGATGPRLKQILCLRIEDADLRELELIDPHRAWRQEQKFQAGALWPLTSHQFRRSLALYAQRSGLVSLPSLRRQLQHITEEMSRYYARGSSFAKSFIGDDSDHFGIYWQNAQPISGALSYVLNVLYSDEVLFGPHATWNERRKLNSGEAFLSDRAATLQRFKKGELAYRETLLGGCVSTDACDKAAINILNVDCVLGCKSLVGRLPKLERAITIQERFVSSLESGSAEFNTEKADLDVLRTTKLRIKQGQL